MSKRTRLILAAGAVVVVIVGGAYAAFAMLAGGSSAAPVSLATGGTGSTSGASLSRRDLQGTWSVSRSGSFVGYRVREQLGFLPAPSDAVGRTSAVTGTLTVRGLSIDAVKLTADLSQLQSDRSQR